MNIQQLLKGYSVMMDCVPLSISEPGFVYLNGCDSGIWLITFNYKHLDINREYITVKQLLQIFRHQSSCFVEMQEKFDRELPQILHLLEQQDPSLQIAFR